MGAFGTEATLAASAAFSLGRNTNGNTIKPAPALYPHQWSWDSAFISIGLARFQPHVAQTNLDALFAGQWANGMVPHIVFDPEAQGYFPGPDRWACAELNPDAPRAPATSGLCQPAVHAIAASAIVNAANGAGPAAAEQASQWLSNIYPKLLAWHRFLAHRRVDEGTGLIRIHHGWESGMDNSPRWDKPYGRVFVGPSLPPYKRRDLEHVSDPSQRPGNEEYDKYLWLVEEAKAAHYDPAAMARTCTFQVGDVFFTAIFAAANDCLAELARLTGAPDAPELERFAAEARAAVHKVMEPSTGLTPDVDLLTRETLSTDTVASFSALIAGGLPRTMLEQLVERLMGSDWAGAPGLRWRVPPSTSPGARPFNPRSYWRGPVWPVITWTLISGLERAGERSVARRLREETLRQVAEGSFAEYYEPFTGEPLGSAHQSWTAAVTIDLLYR